MYVFLAVEGHLECCACSISDDWKHLTTDDMIAHLREHEKRGHTVPPSVFVELEENREEDAWTMHDLRIKKKEGFRIRPFDPYVTGGTT